MVPPTWCRRSFRLTLMEVNVQCRHLPLCAAAWGGVIRCGDSARERSPDPSWAGSERAHAVEAKVEVARAQLLLVELAGRGLGNVPDEDDVIRHPVLSEAG